MADIELARENLMLEKAKMDSQERIAGAQLGAKSTFDKQKLQMDQQAKGVELGLDAARSQLDRQHAKELAHINKKDQTQPKE